ncbi:ABC transporter ATP-binding protein [Spirillospora sp. CA-128828]|uniref:ABC transporter ATP-binding protein n=1 Tax=Spirillospora sp. CA-128828 TaxID=3240033 RepID=UPI003D94A0A1
MTLLRVTDLHSRYGQVEALSGISFEVGEGEIVALLGSNGAGKTTTLRTVTGLHRARSGRVELDGRDITRLVAHKIVAAGLGHVPEGRRVFPALNVAENLLLGGYLRRRDRAAVAARREEVYEMFPRLGERRGQLAGLLSGGEQQMLAIGRALMLRPRLLALDEPTMGLAPQMAQQVLRVVREIRDQGTTILIVEQNAHQTLRLADRAYVLETGRIVLDGAASALAQDDRVKAAYLGGDPVIEAT